MRLRFIGLLALVFAWMNATNALANPQLISPPSNASTTGANSILVRCSPEIAMTCSASAKCLIGVWMIVTSGVGSINPPSGYTMVPNTALQTPLGRTTSLFVHPYASGDTLQPQFTFSGSGSAEYICAGYSGVDPNTPVDASAGMSNGSATTLTAPSVTSTDTDGSLLMLYATDYSGVFSYPSAGLIDATDQNNGRGLAWVDTLPVATGPTGLQSIDFNMASTGVGVQVVLHAASTDPSITPTPAPTSTPLSNCPVSVTLVNGQNPITYGADNTGHTDATSAFQSAINAGDLRIPAGTYLLDGVISIPSNRNVYCQPNVVLNQPTVNTRNPFPNAMFTYYSAGGGGVYNCSFRGPNYNVPGAGILNNANGNQEFIYFLNNGAGNHTVECNDFNGSYGYTAAVESHGNPYDVIANNVISYNSAENCGYYFLQESVGTNWTVSHNTLNDCSASPEADTAGSNCGTHCSQDDPSYNGQINTGNIWSYNQLTFTHGTGLANNLHNSSWNAYGCGDSAGGTAFDYSGNTCENDSIKGVGSSHLDKGATGSEPGYPPFNATYLNETCAGGCSIVN